MRHPISTILLTAFLGLFAACTRPAEDTAAKSATPATPAIATVNGKPISSEFFDEFLTAATGQPAAQATPEQKSQLLDQLLNMSVAAQSAETDGLANDAAVKTRLELLRLQVLAEAASEKFMKAHPSTEAEIKAEYDTQVAAMPKEYRARHILVDSKETAESVIRELDAGGDFAKLASKQSKDQASAAKGGELDWFRLDHMVKPFSDAVLALDKGQTTKEPVQSEFGWHVIRLEDERSPAAPAFEEVKDRVDMIVKRKKLQAHFEELRKTANVQKKS
jgi:peptidyl-prolyl cis-trans isomerase C